MTSRTLKKFQKLKGVEKDLARVQDNIEVQFNQIITKELLDGQILTQVTLIPGKINRVQHKLGRQIEGWTIVRKRADARVWDVQDCEGNKSVYLALIVSHEVEVDIWVF